MEVSHNAFFMQLLDLMGEDALFFLDTDIPASCVRWNNTDQTQVGCVAVFVLSLVASPVAGLELWLPGREVVYQYETSLQAGTIFPVTTVSQWHMSGKLIVQGAEHQAMVQVSIDWSTLSCHLLGLLSGHFPRHLVHENSVCISCFTQ
jgi:hypothetical protein